MATNPKKPKLQNQRLFQNWWTDEFAMLDKGDKAVCGFCSKTVVCRTSSVKRHYETVHPELLTKTKDEQKEHIKQILKKINAQSSALKKFVGGNLGATRASFIVSKEIGTHGKPFSDGDYIKNAWLKSAPDLFSDFENKEKIINRIKAMPLSRNTVKDRILKMADDISDQQVEDINESKLISICLDESTDITGSARLAIFSRYCVKNTVKEELISLVTLETTTKGIDICNAVEETLMKKKIDISKIVSITTDGAASMIGEQNGFIKLFTQKIGHPIIPFHCIIHQQALCAKNGFKPMTDIMSTVTKIVNFICARALNKRKFSKLLEEVESEYSGLLMYNNVRWLSRGKVLERFVECFNEIKEFLKSENDFEKYERIMDLEWESNLRFFTDLCAHINELNCKLQGLNKTIITMFDLIKAFEAKLVIFKRDVQSNVFKYFPRTKDFFQRKNLDKTNLVKQFIVVLDAISSEFEDRFHQFRKIENTTKFIIFPDEINFEELNVDFLNWINLEKLEMELVEFQASSTWKQKFVDLRSELEKIEKNRLEFSNIKNADDKILECWNAIPENFLCMKALAEAFLTIFSSTYSCEALFSSMNYIKNIQRNRLTDESSAACTLLKVTKYEADINALALKVDK